ncbi:MAG: molecular chaperone [Xanthobacteraceae bacterium]|nr:molecular chaperone [Xanthobacteraceae bacterium]
MRIAFVVLFAFLANAHASLWAASLQVAPVSVEVQAPSATATVTIRNEGIRPLNAQIRVYRWTLVNGTEQLTPTEDVVASPPMTSLAPGADYTIRVVRMVKNAVEREEAYRLLIDEIPDGTRKNSSGVNIAVRYSIPVFFTKEAKVKADVIWSIEKTATRYHLVAKNLGNRRVRIANLKLRDNSGKTISFGTGLVGYVLENSTARWPFPRGKHELGVPGDVAVSAESDNGPINTRVIVRRAN